MKTAVDILQQFCAPVGDATRAGMAAPFSLGKDTFATDGRILVQVKRVDGVERNRTAPNPRITLFNGFPPNLKWKTLAAVATTTPTTTPTTEPNEPIRLGGNFYSAKYLRLIGKLDSVEVAPRGEPKAPLPFRFHFVNGPGRGLLMPLNPRAVLTVGEVARILGVSGQHVGELESAGELRCMNMSVSTASVKTRRFPVAWLEQFLEARLIDPIVGGGPVVAFSLDGTEEMAPLFVTLLEAARATGLRQAQVVGLCDVGTLVSVNVAVSLGGERIARRITKASLNGYLAGREAAKAKGVK